MFHIQRQVVLHYPRGRNNSFVGSIGIRKTIIVFFSCIFNRNTVGTGKPGLNKILQVIMAYQRQRDIISVGIFRAVPLNGAESLV